MSKIVASTDQSIALAAQQLRDGGVVAFPTETVYGLGGGTFQSTAIETIYRLKGRPFDNPLIAHVLDWPHAANLVSEQLPEFTRSLVLELTNCFWPGPLTLVLPKAATVPAQATAGLETIAVRAPADPIARRLLHAFGSPISAPSANRSGHVSPTTAEHVAADFPEDDLLILDGGACQVGIESTVLDLTTSPAKILRPGSVTADQLRPILGAIDTPLLYSQTSSPGTRSQHYSPRTPAFLISSAALVDRLRQSSQSVVVLAIHPHRISPPHNLIAMPNDATAYAQRIYSALRDADALNCSEILIEEPPRDAEEWSAIHDRLRRAVAKPH